MKNSTRTIRWCIFNIIVLFILLGGSYSYANTVVSAVPEFDDPLPGSSLKISVYVDLTAVTDKLGAYEIALTWAPSVLTYESLTGGTSSGYSSVNYLVVDSDPDAGIIAFTGLNPSGAGGLVHIADVLFTVSGSASETTSVNVTVNMLWAATSIKDLTEELTLVPGHIEVAYNFPPEITTTILSDATQNQSYETTIAADDSNERDVITFSLAAGPDWMTIDETTGILSGTPSHDDVGANIPVKIIVTDSGNLADTLDTNITVLEEPKIIPPVTVGSSGGSITVSDVPELAILGLENLVIEIPESALTEPVDIQIDISEDIPENVSAEIQVEFTISGHSEQFDFIIPILISIPYPDTISNESDLTLRLWDEELQNWIPLELSESIVVNVDENTISARITHFSVYGIMYESYPPVIETNDLQDAIAGQMYSETIIAQDRDHGDVLSYIILSGPLWLSINGNGELTGTPSENGIGTDIPISIKVEDSGGLFDTFSTTIEVTEDVTPVVETAISRFSISSPYPNPFNPTTTITYNLPRESAVEFVIFNVLGRKIAVLQEGVMSAGSHSIVWDGTDHNGETVGNGVYLYRFTAENYVRHGKVMFIR